MPPHHHYHHRPPRSRSGTWFKFLMMFLFIGFVLDDLDDLLEEVFPLLLLGGMGYLGYRWVKGQKALTAQKTQLRIEDLKESIRQTDGQLQLLDGQLETGQINQYAQLARQLLPQLNTIQKEADQLKGQLTGNIYQRISAKVRTVTQDITRNLSRLEHLEAEKALTKEERTVQKLAPELLEGYRRIKTDDAHIREKIKTAKNPAELTAIQDGNMERFQTILDGYLNIKQSPKDYYNAEERLNLAREALEQFDLELDELLRQLNEADMLDFEVNLRMMTDKTRKEG